MKDSDTKILTPKTYHWNRQHRATIFIGSRKKVQNLPVYKPTTCKFAGIRPDFLANKKLYKFYKAIEI